MYQFEHTFYRQTWTSAGCLSMLDVKYVTFVRKKCLKDTHVNKRSEAVILQFMDYVTKII